MDPRGTARDEDIGLSGYLTATPPLGGRLKVRIDDFHVVEVGGLPPEVANGRYTCAVVHLTNWETNKFVQAASERLQMSRKKIHFSGTKDKRGVTTRAFTFEAPLESVEQLSRLPGVELDRAYRCDEETRLGRHTRNAFEMVLRDVPGSPEHVRGAIEATWTEAMGAGGFPNVFGPQRFGTLRATTHRVGERIVRGDFRGAIEAYLHHPPPRLPSDEAHEWMASLAKWDVGHMLDLARGDQGFERTLLHRLQERPDDPVHALLGLPKNLQLLFIYAYQSYLFNRILSLRLVAKLPLGRATEGDLIAPVEDGEIQEEWVPVRSANLERVNEEIERGRAAVTGLLPGTEAPVATGKAGQLEAQILAEAHVSRSDFVVPEHLEWSSKGTRRALVVRPGSFRFDGSPDDLHPGRSMVRFAFDLPKGAYATSVLREFMKNPDLSAFG